jgi:cytochrome c biogenesis factor
VWTLTLWLAIFAATLLILQPKLHEKRNLMSFLCHLALALPFIALSSRFLVNDTSIMHVAAYGGAALPLKYRFAATWAAREGPILLWVLWMSLLSWIWRKPLPGEEVEDAKGFTAHQIRLRLIHGFSLLLLVISLILDPFKANETEWIGRGLNELLQTDLMVIHPPLVFLSYSLCLHLTAISISSFYSSNSEEIQNRILTVARPALFFATLGIGLGGLWAYLILDWGGYWAWDPVETGSFLPWLALVIIVHLRTRPGKTPDNVWIGAGLVAGALAIFATLVTRAGGVWASSVHTFVVSDGGTPPSEAFGRFMVLRGEEAGVEVMSYLVLILLIIGVWFTMQRRSIRSSEINQNSLYLFFIPVLLAIFAFLFDLKIYGLIPIFIFPIIVYLHLIFDILIDNDSEDLLPLEWQFPAAKIIPILLMTPIVLSIIKGDVLFSLLSLIFFIPMFYSINPTKQWGWATGGIMLALASAWSGLVELPIAASVLIVFVSPWLLVEDDKTKSGQGFDITTRKDQQRMALWATVVISGLYLILTLSILLASIDSVNLNAHELYGAPFMLAIAIAMFTYVMRKEESKTIITVVLSVLTVSILLSIFAPEWLGQDAQTTVSEYITRGSIAWISLPMLLVTMIPMVNEVFAQIQRKSRTPILKRIPVGAHLIHLGLILLMIGHIFTTTLVNREDASHRVSLVQDEIIIHGDYGYQFIEIILEDDGLEVGDGYVGIRIAVYEMDENSNGVVKYTEIAIVEPGMLRFDTTGTARSEVDTLSRWHGDIVFIFDGSQANGLMQQARVDGLDSIEMVRVTIYDLPNSHLVWSGWSLMLIGMAHIAIISKRKNSALSDDDAHIEQEE